MLSTSGEAFYALDNLRYRANVSYNAMAALMDWDSASYRAVVYRLKAGVLGGLNGDTDIKVRKAIAFLIWCLHRKQLPLKDGGDISISDQLFKLLREFKAEMLDYNAGGALWNDPVGFIEAKQANRDQSIATSELIEHAFRFAPYH